MTHPSALRIALVGAGHMGRLHAAKLADLQRAGEPLRIVGVADIKLDRAQQVAVETGARASGDHRAWLGACDAAIVAVPTVDHFAVVRDLLEAGAHVLVEKPIAAELAHAEALVATAARTRRVLHVGHLEWHNAALRAIAPIIRRPRFVEAHRLGPFPGRATDVDIIRDLMIHDLDILQRLLGEQPESIESIGVPVVSQQVDIANARLRFPGGCIANFTASRVSPTPLRKLRLFQSDGYFSIDFLAQSAVIVRRRRDTAGDIQLDVEPIELDADDALAVQTRAFLGAIRGREDAGDSSRAAVSALRTALRVIDSLPPLDELQ